MCNTSLQKQTELEQNARSSHPISQPSGQNANSIANDVLAFCSADVHDPSGETDSQWPKANQPGYPALITELDLLFEKLSSGCTRHNSGFTVWCIQTCKWAHDVNVSWESIKTGCSGILYELASIKIISFGIFNSISKAAWQLSLVLSKKLNSRYSWKTSLKHLKQSCLLGKYI